MSHASISQVTARVMHMLMHSHTAQLITGGVTAVALLAAGGGAAYHHQMEEKAQQATISTVASAKAPTPSTPVKKKAVVKSKTKTAPKKTDDRKPQSKASVAAKDNGKAAAPSTPQATAKSQTQSQQSQSSNGKASTKHLVTETYLIKPAWTETIYHPGYNETIHHDATYKTIPLYTSSDGKFQTTDQNAMEVYCAEYNATVTITTTQVVDKPAYDEAKWHPGTTQYIQHPAQYGSRQVWK